jgi:transposase-like protein
VQCPKCKSERFIKDGIVKSKQRYKCKTCNFRYTVTQKSTEKPLYLKRFALQLYLEGLGFRSIGRVLKVSNVSILNWIRQFGEQVKSLQSDEPASITEMDEMHTYIGTKKTINGYGLLLIDMKRDSSTSLLATEALPHASDFGLISKNNLAEK